MKKRLSCLLLVVVFLIPASALAAPPELSEQETLIMKPAYVDMLTAQPRLSVSGTKASYSLKVTGKSTVTKITATMQIQKRGSNGSYTNFGSSWAATASGRTLFTSGTKTVTSGEVYRLKVTIKLYTGSTYTTETVYS